MKTGDKVYYLYTDKYDKEIKLAALVVAISTEGIHIRVGRFDILSSKFGTFEATVAANKLSPRAVPCSFENELNDTPVKQS